MLGKKVPCGGRILDLCKTFHFKPITYSVLLLTFNSNILNEGLINKHIFRTVITKNNLLTK